KGIRARIVSMPCWELFAEQPADYREAVLPRAVTRRLSVESGVTFGWQKWTGDHGRSIGIDRFGASAPGPRLMKEFGFTAEHVVAETLAMMWRTQRAWGAPSSANRMTTGVEGPGR